MIDARPSLAVVIPTLGRQSLREALGALQAQQETRDFVVVVVHGPEDSGRIQSIVSAAGPDLALRAVSTPDRSVGARRNRGVEACSSPWVAFTDDDCRVPPHWVADLARFRRAHPEVEIAGGSVVEPARRSPIYTFMRRINYMTGPETMKRRPGGIPSLGCANLLVGRAAFERLGGFDPSLDSTEDYELLVRARQAGLSIGTYLEAPPVDHWHETDLRTFVRRYRAYGRGVAQTVLRHRLDPAGHRLDLGSGIGSRLRAWLRFARQDLRQFPPRAAGIWWARLGVHGLLALVRAAAWQQGARAVWREEVARGA